MSGDRNITLENLAAWERLAQKPKPNRYTRKQESPGAKPLPAPAPQQDDPTKSGNEG